MKLRLYSEFGPLKKLIMHRPGPEIERLTPHNTSELLFEDVPFLEEMQKEHDEYTTLIKNVTDAKVYRLKDLLFDVLKEERLRYAIIKEAIKANMLPGMAEEITGRYSTAECVNFLIAGLKVLEFNRKNPGFTTESLNHLEYLIPPSPNLYFMRDPAAIVQGGVISSNMKYSGRQFESTLLKTIFQNHHEFRDSYHRVYPPAEITQNVPSIEGGDVLVISEKTLAIGSSERTDPEAIYQVAQSLLKMKHIERLYEVRLPANRNYMHLDTVFTLIDENLALTYSTAMEYLNETTVYRAENTADGTIEIHSELQKKSLITILKEEIPHLEVIETGSGHPDFSSREQWYDGANVFAIGPRRVISYDRNKFTNRALREAGVEVFEIRSSELSRGLGGPRCMTMPLERDSVKHI